MRWRERSVRGRAVALRAVLVGCVLACWFPIARIVLVPVLVLGAFPVSTTTPSRVPAVVTWPWTRHAAKALRACQETIDRLRHFEVGRIV